MFQEREGGLMKIKISVADVKLNFITRNFESVPK